jgi:hypothetical protein
MKRTLLYILLIFSTSQLHSQIVIPQLQQGVPMEYLIQNLYYTNTGLCPTELYSVYVYPVPLAQGIEWKVVVDSVAGNPSYAPPASTPLNDGDTLTFTTANSNTFTFSLPTGALAYMRLIVSGTPSSSSQPYPCHIQTGGSGFTCATLTEFTPDSSFSNCTVNPSSVPELSSFNNYNVYADYSNHFIKIIASTVARANFTLFDITGKKVLEKAVNRNETFVDIEGRNGIYIWHVSTADRNFYGKIHIQ